MRVLWRRFAGAAVFLGRRREAKLFCAVLAKGLAVELDGASRPVKSIVNEISATSSRGRISREVDVVLKNIQKFALKTAFLVL